MKLNMMHRSNQAWIENRKIALHNAKEKEHQIVHDVVDLMIIVLDSPLQKRRNKAYNIEKLERKMRHNQNHLNTLADLAVLYRNSNLPDQAAIIEEQIDTILKRSDPNDIIEKAICVLEQGYAALFEEYTENGLEAQQRLLESVRLINVEQRTAVGQKKDVLNRALNYTMEARRLLFQALNYKTNVSFFDKNSSVELLKKGFQYLSNTSYPKEKYYIWNFYYAMACSRMPDIEVATSGNTSISEKAVNLFWSVIKNLSKDNECFTIYRARSYAYIGHILISTNKPSIAYPKYSSLNNDKQFQSLLTTPLSSFEYATNELADDEVVLSREGISLWLMFKFGPGVKNIKHLEKAERKLSFSISQNPLMRRIDFSTRMKVYLEMFSLKQFSLDKREDLLKKALEDGETSIKHNLNAKDVCTVAEICQRLAKFPKFYLYGPEAVSNNEYLHAALDYLNQCVNAKGQNYFTSFTFGVIYFDLGEFRTASKWHKRAFMISNRKKGNGNIKQLLFSILKMGEGSHVYDELIHVLTCIARKWKDVEFLRDVVPKVHGEDYVRSLSKFLIFLQTYPLTAQQVEIAECLKAMLIKKDFFTADQFGVSQYKTSTTHDFEYDMKPESVLQRVQMEINSAGVQQSWRYDYFVIMSKVNSGWIQCFLQHQLSIQMIDGDRTFTGFPGIDYESCSSLLETTIDGINKSRKSILVLSKDLLTREWCLLKTIFTETLKKRSDSICIILLENCDVPSEIDYKHLLYFDFTDEMTIPFEIQHLKLALLNDC